MKWITIKLMKLQLKLVSKQQTKLDNEITELKATMESVLEMMANLVGEVHHLATIVQTTSNSSGSTDVMVDAFRGRGS